MPGRTNFSFKIRNSDPAQSKHMNMSSKSSIKTFGPGRVHDRYVVIYARGQIWGQVVLRPGNPKYRAGDILKLIARSDVYGNVLTGGYEIDYTSPLKVNLSEWEHVEKDA